MIVDGLSAGVGAIFLRKNGVMTTPKVMARFQSKRLMNVVIW
jgi:hypothetical protein